MMRVNKARVFALLPALFLLEPLASAGTNKPVVAVIGVEASRIKLSRSLLDGLSDHLAVLMAGTGQFQVVPRQEVSKKLGAEKQKTFSLKYDQKSAVELGKELAAQKILVGRIIKFGKHCTANLQLFDLGTATAERATSVNGSCDEKGLQALLDTAVQRFAAGRDAGPLISLRTNIMGERRIGNDYVLVDVQEGSLLRSGDGLKIGFETDRDAYVYALLHDSQGKGSVIFPSSEIEVPNRVRGGQRVLVPPDDQWFFLDENKGTETIYVLASVEPLPNIKNLVVRLETLGADRDDDQADHEVAGFLTREAVKRRRRPVQDKKKKQDKKTKEQQARERRRPMAIAGVVRGIGGIKKGPPVKVKLTGGKVVEKASEMLTAAGTVVRAVSFRHE